MGWRSRLARGWCAWLACLVLQVATAPAAEAAVCPSAAVYVAGEPAVQCQARHEVAQRAVATAIVDTLRRPAMWPTRSAGSRELPPAGTHARRVLVERLYLRVLSIRC